MKQVRFIAAIVLLSIGISASAQTLNDAGIHFNKGLELEKAGSNQEAIKSYEECLLVCDKLGKAGVTLKTRSLTQISKIYFNEGIELYKGKKPDEAIAAFTKSFEYAEKNEDKKQMAKSNKYINYAYTYKGNVLNAGKDYEGAIKIFEEANKYYLKNPKTYYGMEIAYAKLDNEEKMRESASEVLRIDKEGGKTATKAKEVAAKFYIGKVPAEVTAKKYQQAIDLINKSFTFDQNNATAYYYMALCYNEMNNYDGAIKGVQAGLALESDDKTTLYYELARAFEGKGDNAQACENYAQAVGGENSEISTQAQDKLTQLGCN